MTDVGQSLKKVIPLSCFDGDKASLVKTGSEQSSALHRPIRFTSAVQRQLSGQTANLGFEDCPCRDIRATDHIGGELTLANLASSLRVFART